MKTLPGTKIEVDLMFVLVLWMACSIYGWSYWVMLPAAIAQGIFKGIILDK